MPYRIWLATAVLYALLGAFGLALAIPPGYASPVFPAAGLALAAALYFGPQCLAAIWLGSVTLNLGVAVLHDSLSLTKLLVALGIGSGAALQAWLGQYLVQRWSQVKWRRLEQEKDTLRFLVLGGVLACCVSATCGVGTLFLAGVIPDSAIGFAWWTWYVGDTLGVLTTAPLVLGLLQRQQSDWNQRLKTMAAPVLGLLALSIVAFVGVTRWEKATQQDQVGDQGQVLAQALEHHFIAHHEILASLARLFELTPDIGPTEFDYLTRITLSDHPELSALSFNTYVSQAARSEFEHWMTGVYSGVPFAILESDQADQLVPASERPDYVPITYISPLGGNQEAIGFDIKSEPIRREALLKAWKSGQATATAPVHLVQDELKKVGVLILTPVFQQKLMAMHGGNQRFLLGFTVGVIKVDEMVDFVLKDRLPPGLILELEDPLTQASQSFLYRSDHQSALMQLEPLWESQLMMANRIWTVRLFASDEYAKEHRPMLAWGIGVIGLLFSGLLQVLLLAISGRAALIQRRVYDQTQELKIKSDKLIEHDEFMRKLINVIPGMVSYWGLDLRCRFANSSYLEWFGKTQEQMQGIEMLDLLGSELFEKTKPFIESVLLGECQNFERYLIKANGDAGYTFAHYVPEVVEGKINGFFVLVSDVTELKLMQLEILKVNKELKKRTTEAEAASKAKSQFLAVMSHEIRTPLNAIIGMSYILGLTDLNKDQRDQLATIESASQALLAQINDILDLTKIEAGEITLESLPFELSVLIEDLERLLSPEAHRKGLELRLMQDWALYPARLEGDVQKLRQMLINLLGNAIKFTKSGSVRLYVDVIAFNDPEITLRFSVTDTGIGLDPEVLSKLFQPFVQADASTTRKFGGSGLGLALVRQLCEHMGGRVGVESTLGKGSTFWFELPLSVSKSISESQGRLNPYTVEANCLCLPEVRILVVDDSELNLRVCEKILVHEGAQVTLCLSGSQAIQELEKCPEGFDLVLMDLQMPEMDGFEATRRLRSLLGTRAVPVVALTAGATSFEREQALNTGMDGFLTKPVEPAQLIWTLRQLLEQAHGHSVAIVPRQDNKQLEDDSWWPSIEGLDTKAVRVRLADDKELFIKLIKGFLAESGLFFSQATEALVYENMQVVSSALHKIRGQAGNIGAMTLAHRLGALERSAKSQSLTSEQLLSVKTILVELTEQIGHWLQQVSLPDVGSSASVAVLDMQRLAEFKALLVQHNLAAFDVFKECSGALKASLGASDYAGLEEALNQLDFSSVLAVLSKISGPIK